ncbi:MAG: outer membrane beta-barrel protein [Salinivirgaceae bacterium]|nr:outer membrane beta-barrel protein [Salinivirgaceae bacterium]
MKKIFLSVLAIAAMATTANAQLWLGGSLGFRHSDGASKTSDTNHKTSGSSAFTFAPIVGFDLNEQLSIGGKLNLIMTSQKDYSYDINDKESELKTSGSGVGAIPFARYKFIEFNKFGVVAEAGLPISYTSSKTDNGSNTIKGNPQTNLGLYMNPILTYNLNDNFQLECGLNFLSLNASHTVTKDRDDSKKKTVSNNFRFGANTNNVVNVGDITIGFIYKL